MPSLLIYLSLLMLFLLGLFLYARWWRQQTEGGKGGGDNGRFARLLNWLLSPPGSTPATPVATAPPAAKATPDAAPAFTAERLRVAISGLLAGGLLLAVLGQIVYTRVPYPERWWIFLLTGMGVGAFILGGHTAVSHAPPRWLIKPARRLSHFLNVSGGQLVLLFLAPCFAWMARLAAGDGLLAWHAPVSIIAWLVAIGLVVAGAYRKQEGRVEIGRWEILFLIILGIVAFVVRGTATAQIPTTFSGDEGSAGLAAVRFIEGEANNLFSLGWFSFPALYFVLPGAGIALFGQTIEALRLTSALGGALAVIAVYGLGRALFDRTVAVLAAAYLAASHYHIHISRIGLNNVWDSLFGTLAILGLWHGWKTGRRSGFILCGLVLGLGQYFYVSVRVLPLLFLLWAAVAFWRQRPTFRQRFSGLIMAAFVALIVFLPLGLFFVHHPDEFNAPFARVTIFGEWLENRVVPGERTAQDIIVEQMINSALGYTHRPLRLLYEAGVPLLLPAAAVLFLVGVLWAILHFDLRYLLLLLPILVVVPLSGLGRNAPAAQRYILAMPLVAIVLAVPLAQAAQWLRHYWSRHRLVVYGLVAAIMLWIMVLDLNFYFLHAYDRFTLGGANTETATAIAYYLRDQETAAQKAYFFGFPRMGYFSLSTIPYLAPAMTAEDVEEPLTAAPAWQISERVLFIFLPERLDELQFVQAAYPHGDYYEFSAADGEFLFAVYEVDLHNQG